jgi:phage terminase large subunit GpA-like protein
MRAAVSTVAGGVAPAAMATCEVCGNDYWMSFEIHTAGAVHTFDSFECAIQGLAPVCEHCQCRIIGHGVEVEGRFFCGAHCARTSGVRAAAEIRDTVGTRPG